MTPNLTTTTILKLLILLSGLDGLIELSLTASCLGWLAAGASGPYHLPNPFIFGAPFLATPSRPAHLLIAPANFAAATGGVTFFVSLFGGLALWLRSSPRYREGRWARGLAKAWPWACVLGVGLTFAATVALNVTIDMHTHQEVDLVVVAELARHRKYPVDTWSLPGWFGAVGELVVDEGKADTIAAHLRTMSGWRWNLVPLLVLQAVMGGVAWMEGAQWARRVRTEQSVRMVGMDVWGGDADKVEKGVMG